MDFDPRHYQHAPLDQQVTPHLRGGDQVELGHVTPCGVLQLPEQKIGITYCDLNGERHRSEFTFVMLRKPGSVRGREPRS